ncbi:MAG TPA: adenylate/guanylate cyclase domain-containing protein, partial [Candidatus Limnocylindria bacterium]|nr:adenylate/guanylate cyclase domain-containing protein [Candidatus Limnocylindria bacterium]
MQEGREVERRIVSVLFADLVGFTPLSEGLDPEDVATIQDAYFARVRDVMQRHGGQLEKFIGDAAMAVFGVPRSRDDDAERAIAAGLALIGAVEALGAELGLEPGRLRVRVGINTGEVVSAESGPDVGRVTGDTVNVAARLQAAAQPSQVLIGELTAFAVAATVEIERVEPLSLKGKAEPVHAAIARAILPRSDRARAMGTLRAPLVGRQRELELVLNSIRSAETSAGWLIVAQPGVGKSRLLSELAEAAGASGAVWRAQVRVGGASPFEPVAQLLLAALGRAGIDLEGARAALAARLDAAGMNAARASVLIDRAMVLVQPPRAEPAAGSHDRDELFAAWLETFDALQRTHPTDRAVWIFEDLHWAAPDLVAFLASAATAAAARRTIVCSTRPGLLHDPQADAAFARFTRMELPALGAQHADELVRRLIGNALPDELVDRIVERSDGNALFIEELLRSWIGAGLLIAEPSGAWQLTQPPDELPLPATVQAIYAGQLDDLPATERRLARRASVAGRRFVRESLPALHAHDDAALEALRSRGLVSGPQQALLGGAYAYRHALLRDAGYASLGRLERSDLHARLARWLETASEHRAGLIAAEIAQQYLDALTAMPQLAQQLPGGVRRADLAESAAAWLDRAAEQAVATAAPQAAGLQLRSAIEITPASDRATLARRWLALAEAIAFSGKMGDAVAALDRSIELFQALLEDDPTAASRDGFARAVALRGTVRIEQLQFREAEAAASVALERLGGEADDLAAARLRYLRAWARVAYSPTADVEDDLERARAAAAAAGNRQLEIDAASMLDEVRLERAQIEVDAFLDGRERIVELARESGQSRLAGAALRTIAIMGVERGR